MFAVVFDIQDVIQDIRTAGDKAERDRSQGHAKSEGRNQIFFSEKQPGKDKAVLYPLQRPHQLKVVTKILSIIETMVGNHRVENILACIFLSDDTILFSTNREYSLQFQLIA